jgi:integrase
MAGKTGARGFGRVRKLPSGRWQAFYGDPSGKTRLSKTGNVTPIRHAAPHTFVTKLDAEAWLTDERRLISAGTWISPALRELLKAEKAQSMPTFDDYATEWLRDRKVKGRPLSPRTRDHYTRLLEDYLSPALGELKLDQINHVIVNRWYDDFTPKTKRHQGRKTDGSTTKAHTYSIGRAILNTAIAAGGPIAGQPNPFAIRGAGQSPDNKREEVATAAELEIMLDTIRPGWRTIILIGLWTGLRYGEIAELRRGDVDLPKRVLRIRRAVSRSKSAGVHAKDTKSAAGKRNQRIPEAIAADIEKHLKDHVKASPDALLFPGRAGLHLSPATFYGRAPVYGKGRQAKGKPEEKIIREGDNGWYHARTEAGHPALHFHDLRATGATLLAGAGASIAEVQAFLGDSTPAAAMRYVRAAQSRMDMLTDKLSQLAENGGW